MKISDTKITVVCSAPTIERLEKIIREYFGQPTILTLGNDGTVTNSEGIIDTVTWRKKGRRWQLVRHYEA